MHRQRQRERIAHAVAHTFLRQAARWGWSAARGGPASLFLAGHACAFTNPFFPGVVSLSMLGSRPGSCVNSIFLRRGAHPDLAHPLFRLPDTDQVPPVRRALVSRVPQHPPTEKKIPRREIFPSIMGNAQGPWIQVAWTPTQVRKIVHDTV